MEVVSGNNWSYGSCRAPVISSPINAQLYYRLDARSIDEPTASKAEGITFHRHAHPKLNWDLPTFSSTIKASWLLRRRVAKLLISSLMPEPQPRIHVHLFKYHKRSSKKCRVPSFNDAHFTYIGPNIPPTRLEGSIHTPTTINWRAPWKNRKYWYISFPPTT